MLPCLVLSSSRHACATPFFQPAFSDAAACHFAQIPPARVTPAYHLLRLEIGIMVCRFHATRMLLPRHVIVTPRLQRCLFFCHAAFSATRLSLRGERRRGEERECLHCLLLPACLFHFSFEMPPFPAAQPRLPFCFVPCLVLFCHCRLVYRIVFVATLIRYEIEREGGRQMPPACLWIQREREGCPVFLPRHSQDAPALFSIFCLFFACHATPLPLRSSIEKAFLQPLFFFSFFSQCLLGIDTESFFLFVAGR